MTRIFEWGPDLSPEELKDGAYWERNVLALRYAEGWYNDDIEYSVHSPVGDIGLEGPRFPGFRRVLTLDGGKITFHIPDDFPVGNLPEVQPNWDGHSTKEKWSRILQSRGIDIQTTCVQGAEVQDDA